MTYSDSSTYRNAPDSIKRATLRWINSMNNRRNSAICLCLKLWFRLQSHKNNNNIIDIQLSCFRTVTMAFSYRGLYWDSILLFLLNRSWGTKNWITKVVAEIMKKYELNFYIKEIDFLLCKWLYWLYWLYWIRLTVQCSL